MLLQMYVNFPHNQNCQQVSFQLMAV